MRDGHRVGSLVPLHARWVTWRIDMDEAAVGSGAVHAMAASEPSCSPHAKIPNESVPPELRLYHLDREKDWQKQAWSVNAFCPEKATTANIGAWWSRAGMKNSRSQLPPSFVALQSRHSTQNSSAGQTVFMNGYRHFTYRWSEEYAIVETRELGTESGVLGSVAAPRLTAVLLAIR